MEIRLKNKKDYARWSLLGMLLFIFGVLILIFDPSTLLVRHMLKMREGSMSHEMWKKVPVEILINIYLFNITNGERFMSGKDSKLQLQEIGPYVFKETRENYNITFHDNGTMSYVPNVTIVPVPELSAGDPLVDRVICLNIPFMGIFSNNGNASSWKQIGLNIFAKSINAEALLDLSVNEIMWGYDDKLVRLASGYYPDWISFSRFGILDRMYADMDDVITLDLDESFEKLYTIDSWNGVSGLKVWGYTDDNTSLPCNTLRGAYEGLMFPSNLPEGSNINVYKKSFCRTLRLYHKKTQMMESGLLGYVYELPYSALSCSNPDNVCYCPVNGTCLPDGLTDVSPCYYGLPVAISFPHFLGANKTLLERFDGLDPQESEHSSNIIIQPNIGLPMKVTSKIQLNLVLDDMKYNSKLKSFSKMTIPILWMNAKVDGIPRDLELKILIAFKYLPLLQKILSWVLIVGGLLLIIYKSIKYVLVSIKVSKSKRQSPLKYTPVSLNENSEISKDNSVRKCG